MRKIYVLLCGILFMANSVYVKAQSFTVQHDTVRYNYAGINGQSVFDLISNTTSADIKLSWKVIATDFPADWLGATGICDNNLCYNMSPGLWPSMSTMTSDWYHPAITTGDFHLLPALTVPSATPPFDAANGTHYVTVRLQNSTLSTDTAIIVFIISKGTLGVPSVSKADDIMLYPNPANSEVNVVYDASHDVKNIAVYNIIGKMESVYKVNGTSANLNLEHISSGIYFVKLYDSAGRTVGTRKFTKQ
jgi:hypothetical protein